MSDSVRQAPFLLSAYVRDSKKYFDAERLDAMSTNGEPKTIYKVRIGLDYDTTLGASVLHWARWGGPGALLRSDTVCHVDMSSVRFSMVYG